jgi:hypothetical protein
MANNNICEFKKEQSKKPRFAQKNLQNKQQKQNLKKNFSVVINNTEKIW